MKKILLTAFICVVSFAAMSQARQLAGFESNGMPGKKIPDTLKRLIALPPLILIDTTLSFDSSRYYIDTFRLNNTNDSIQINFNGGRRLAAKVPTGGGGLSDTTYLRLTVNNLVTTQQNNKGLELRNYIAATAGVPVQIAPQVRFVSEAYGAVASVNASRLIDWSIYPIHTFNSGSAPTSRLSFFNSINEVTPTEKMYLTSGGSLVMAQNNQSITLNSTSGALTINSSTKDISSSGSLPLNVSNTASNGSVRTRAGTSNQYFYDINGSGLAQINTTNLIVGTSTTTSTGTAQIDMQGTARGFLPSRMTTAQRDALQGVVSVVVNNGGTGYSNINFGGSGGGGSGFSGLLSTSGGVIISVSVNYTGTGYTSAPTLTPGLGSGASLTAVLGTPVGLSVFNTDVGQYQTWNGTSWQTGIVTSGAGTLTLLFGTDYIFTGTTSTYTLPAISSTTQGRGNSIIIKNQGSGSITLNSASGSQIYTTSAQSSITIVAGAACQLLPGATYFNVLYNN